MWGAWIKAWETWKLELAGVPAREWDKYMGRGQAARWVRRPLSDYRESPVKCVKLSPEFPAVVRISETLDFVVKQVLDNKTHPTWSGGLKDFITSGYFGLGKLQGVVGGEPYDRLLNELFLLLKWSMGALDA